MHYAIESIVSYPVRAWELPLDLGRGIDHGTLSITGLMALMQPRVRFSWPVRYQVFIDWSFWVPCSTTGECRQIAIQKLCSREEASDRPLFIRLHVHGVLDHIMRHEVAEGLFLDGERLEDPHPENHVPR